MKKKLLSLALCLSLLPAPAAAASAPLTEIVSADTYESFSQGQPPGSIPGGCLCISDKQSQACG